MAGDMRGSIRVPAAAAIASGGTFVHAPLTGRVAGASAYRGFGAMKRLAPALLALIAVAGCATYSPRARVHDELLRAGVKPRMANCLADGWSIGCRSTSCASSAVPRGCRVRMSAT